MSTVQQHYDQHLGPVYTWMMGGTDAALERGRAEIAALTTGPEGSGLALDLGAGFGMHAIALARLGYRVLAIDSCAALLRELQTSAEGLAITTVQDDLLAFEKHLTEAPELVLCMGDTLTHLADETAVEALVQSVSRVLENRGRWVTTLRDYRVPLEGDKRFIPVRSDDERLLTCFLQWSETHVRVHDILHERKNGEWTMDVSSYDKLRIDPDWLAARMQQHGLAVAVDTTRTGMLRLTARRN